MPPDDTVDIEAIFEDGTAIDEAMNEAVQEAVLQHLHAGLPLIVWRNGRVEEVAPESVLSEQNQAKPDP